MQYSEEPNLDSALYLVPNPHGPGKTVVRRPHPPPTTAPLDDDFDAATIEDSTVYQGRPPGGQSTAALTQVNPTTVERRETYHADPKEYVTAKQGPTTGKLSSLELGLPPVQTPASIKSGADDEGTVQARPRNGASQNDGRRDSKISNAKKGAPDEGRRSRHGGSRVGGAGGNETHRVSVAQGIPEEPPSVTNWRQQVAISRNLDETLSSQDGDDDPTETGQASSRAKDDGSQSGTGHRSGGKSARESRQSSPIPPQDVQSPGKAKVSRSNSKYVNPIRSERMYTLADLDIPPTESTVSDLTMETASTISAKPKHTREPSGGSSSIRAYPLLNPPTSFAPAASTTLSGFLSSFQPSLLHVAPVLASLGIRDEEHLRAVAGLSEETRNREVREIALQKGMTVLEWAMLLDRTRSRT
ncbi:hypothetical protein FIBSPDRAFT_1043017 [Athelia psychrophila]|uniref:Uncharacterized protein n=1 Tax=Athelia psychrophila TaxID=1759441 RepID=A0A166LTS3_9AGAM|nr:hypothetical protein FIBSPDRAFT_1043017 [Fibularhizoctonia sp. CBS 109695]